MKKILFVILDGAGDGLKKRTSLEMAHKPNLDEFTRNGLAGLINNQLDKHPDSGISAFNLFGYSTNYPGRGYLDGLGIGLMPKPNTLYMRANFATVKKETMKVAEGQYAQKFIIIDRRAGREEDGLREISKDIKEIFIEGFKIEFHKSVAHRGVIVISNFNISASVTGNDTGSKLVEPIKATRSDNNSEKTAAILNKWLYETEKILEEHPMNKVRKFPANYILLRGPGSYVMEKTFKEKFGFDGAVIAKSPVVCGIGKHLEMDVIDVPGATADMKTDLHAKTLAALRALDDHNFVILHILGADIAGHDKNIPLKKGFIEKIDRDVFGKIKEYINFDDVMLVVTSDHITSVFTGEHESGLFPFMVYTNGIEANKVQSYYENECKKGPVVDIQNFMEEILKYL